ncbi:hypothetical protein A1Q1_06738 [Trichosporon asahii var. asahii CBS 2479]|uniref:Pre-mRNA polyadenylation factor Fip1 domain-containing protein n=1 Tax=Trichosporon asahii var. asahii (strain ATCC 90039 / CBS 2479 / JCM 2466 / KCTC 7840 / NBRC 103889/ NCYC 2677 / UAMH 7654) TaxID=1186058 RepID=J4UJQ9_TRIAS|nr:hypothetical protein A1Q1_06738 [Trichosporon asahii var. asahii CBS 2479]EJT52025.1 hypothetical protein A1Q1_06738 [Trichosporon asahii var. asahii CBS 2479]
MAASLAAYGIDPSTAVKEETLVEDAAEEGDSDSDSDSDDEVSFVMNAGRGLDLRHGAKQQSHVIGIGKWAHTATSSAPPAASPAPLTGTPSKDALTDYTPAARPGVATSQPAPAAAVPPSAAVTDVKSVPQAGNGPPPTTPLPHSNLAVQTAPANGPHINPTNPTGIIPSTGTSVYDVDVAQFEGSGQMWRRPGSDISDWFNYGFDEVTYPKFLKYRQDMEQGRAALMGNMNQMTPEVAQLLHLPMGQMNNMQQLQMQQQMQQMMAMQGMDQAMFMQMQQMQNMQNQAQGGGQIDGNGQPHGEQEEGSIPQEIEAVPPSGPRGAPASRGGAAIRGRVPTGPRVPAPRGPKNRFRDKDRVTDSAAGSLDYGAEGGSVPHSREASHSRSPSPYERYERRERSRSPSRSRDRSRERERDRDWERDRERERDRDRERERDRDRDRDSRSSRRNRHADGEEGEYQSHDDERSSRRKRSRSVEEERPRRSTRARRER